jgi:3-oxoacyl-[acyl-carrier protein] reductase
MPHKEKVALITGSSRGIGRGIAIKLAKENFTVIINSRTADPTNFTKGAYEVKKTIEDIGGKAEIFRADISSLEERESMANFIENRFGRLDLLVNNAGIEPDQLDILESSEERFDHTFNTNLKGPYFLTKRLAKKMLNWKNNGIIESAYIIFITSVQGHMANPLGAEYCMTKAALHMATKLFAQRLAEDNILVFEIRPGVIMSDMSLIWKENIDKMISSGKVLTRRWGQPDDIAKIVSCISKGYFDYSTGETIEVDGGMGISRLG